MGQSVDEVKNVKGKAEAQDDDDGDKECVICLTEDKNTVLMPCGHFCICDECGRGLVKHK